MIKPQIFGASRHIRPISDIVGRPRARKIREENSLGVLGVPRAEPVVLGEVEGEVGAHQFPLVRLIYVHQACFR